MNHDRALTLLLKTTLLFMMPALPAFVFAQTTTVTGTVTDGRSGDSLASVTVKAGAGRSGTLTNEKGFYTHCASGRCPATYCFRRRLQNGQHSHRGGHTAKHQYPDTAKHGNHAGSDCHKGEKLKYRNKNNPAVELIRQVIEHRDQNRMTSAAYTQFHQYERLTVSLAHLPDGFRKKKFFNNQQSLFIEQDPDAMGGKLLLPLYMEEKSSSMFYRQSPAAQKQIVQGFKQVRYSEDVVSNRGLSTYFNFLYQDIDIYSNNIFLLTNQLLSPVANSGPLFYEYYIRDTITEGNTKLVKLAFRPRNPNDLLFQGQLFIALDGSYAVKQASLHVNSHININFIRQMEISLVFEKAPDNRYYLTRNLTKADFGITKGKTTGMYGERLLTRDSLQFGITQPDNLYKGLSSVIAAGADERDAAFWSAQNTDSASIRASANYQRLDSMQNNPAFKTKMAIAGVLLSGYKRFGKIEMGPLNSFYSFNFLEGSRFRFGGRTTPALSSRFYFEGYGAYGTLDRKFKYLFNTTYSLNNKSIYIFPQKYIRVGYQYDTKIPGQDFFNFSDNNFLLSFQRGDNFFRTYNHIFNIEHLNEFENHFSYTLGFKYWRQAPAGSLEFIQAATPVPAITTAEFSVALRYAPHEKFYQGKIFRVPLVDKYPVFNLRYAQGITGFAGGQYNYKNINLSVSKRFYLSQLGFTNTSIEGGYIFGQVPFPLLTIHRANQTYAFQRQAYNLMNFLEFVSDHYVAVNAEHNFNGFLFNKIPLFKQLKWREIIGTRLLWGGIRNENNPALNPNVFRFPVSAEGQVSTFALQNGPYIEGNIGVGNIFKLIRVDLVKRFTYLQNPLVSPLGVRMQIKFDW